MPEAPKIPEQPPLAEAAAAIAETPHAHEFPKEQAPMLDVHATHPPTTAKTSSSPSSSRRVAIRYTDCVTCEIEFEREDDGRWIAEIPALPGVMAYGASKTEAESKVEAMALRVIADRMDQDMATMSQVRFAAA